MGDRANYVIKSGEEITIYYTHWRSIFIAKDLMSGPKKFISFVQQFDKRDSFLDNLWLEGCVLVDLDKQELVFWESEDLDDTSVRLKYLSLLQKKWINWQVCYSERGMYDIEERLQIDYVSTQEHTFEEADRLSVVNDSPNGSPLSLIVIKRSGQFEAKYVYQDILEGVLLLGKEIVDILLSKPSVPLHIEGEKYFAEIAAIDCDNNRLIVEYGMTSFHEKLAPIWKGWTIQVGQFGYIGLLKLAGLETSNLLMRQDEVDKRLLEITSKVDDFDPKSFAKRVANQKGVKFHPNFFDNYNPKKTLWERIWDLFRGKN